MFLCSWWLLLLRFWPVGSNSCNFPSPVFVSRSDKMCTVGKLFWSAIPDPSKCSGIYQPFGSEENIQDLLRKNHCLERWEDSSHSVQSLIINRITPFSIDPDSLAQISICRFHKVIVSHLCGVCIQKFKKVVRGFLKLLILPNDQSKSSGVLEIRL